MWYPPTVTAPPASEPLTFTDVQSLSIIDYSGYAAQIGQMITTARDYVERFCGTPLVTQTVVVKCDCFDDFAALPVVPVQSVSSVSYVDTSGTPQTLSTDVYEVRAEGIEARIVLKFGQTWPTIQLGSRITVTAIVGYAALPAMVKQALLIIIQNLFSCAERNLFVTLESTQGVSERRFGTTPEIQNIMQQTCITLLENYRARFV